MPPLGHSRTKAAPLGCIAGISRPDAELAQQWLDILDLAPQLLRCVGELAGPWRQVLWASAHRMTSKLDVLV